MPKVPEKLATRLRRQADCMPISLGAGSLTESHGNYPADWTLPMKSGGTVRFAASVQRNSAPQPVDQ